MKTLLMSTCTHALSDMEFVFPISEILGKNEHDLVHFEDCDKKLLSKYDNIIICGTSMQDFSYIDNLPFFEELLSNFEGPILGICSGMQILSLVFGASGLVDNTEVGFVKIKTLIPNKLFEGNFQGYNLHNCSVNECDTFKVLATSDNSIQAVKHKSKEIYGISFHPEVRNQVVVRNFLKI
tara:strand:+ start:383 stop:925 length:543 start_codon:yes stop_codon:yes gene_type:complete